MSKPLPFILRIFFPNNADAAAKFITHLAEPPKVKFMDARISISSKHIVEVTLDRLSTDNKLLDQLQRIVEGLVMFPHFEFVGPVCPREGFSSFMHKKPFMSGRLFPDGSHGWGCMEPKCRGLKDTMISRDDCAVMNYRDFMVLTNALQMKKANGELTYDYGTYRQAAKTQNFIGRYLPPTGQILKPQEAARDAVNSLTKSIGEFENKVLKEVVEEADKMLRFVCGLNIQDLSVKDQRECRERVKALMDQIARVKEKE